MTVIFPDRVSDKQQEKALNLSVGSPALFAAFNSIQDGNEEWIEEYVTSFLEADAMLAPVGDVLGLIPLEPDCRHGKSITTNMHMCKDGCRTQILLLVGADFHHLCDACRLVLSSVGMVAIDCAVADAAGA